MAKNAPYGDNHRHGAVKDRTQVYNPHNQRWTKIDTDIRNCLLIRRQIRNSLKG